MENEDFWDQFLKSMSEPLDNSGNTSVDPTLDSGYRAEDKPTTLDPPKEKRIDIDAIVADIRRQAAAKARNTTTAASHSMVLEKEATDSVTNRVVTPPNTAPPSIESSGDSLGDDRDAMREMTVAMRELTEELRYFRTQVGMQNDQSLPEMPLNPVTQDESDSVIEVSEEEKKTNKALSVISNILFYVVIVAMVLGAFLLKSTSKGQPFMVAGFSAANILTSSMEDVYPRGTLIITKSVKPSELKIGDDITFMVSEDTSITHRIIKASKDPVSGDYMFTTKGTNNQKADEDPVSEANVVGKVVFSSKFLGDTANFIKVNWPILIFVLIVIIGLITFLKWNAKTSYDEDDKDKKEKPTPNTKKRMKSAERRTVENEHEEV